MITLDDARAEEEELLQSAQLFCVSISLPETVVGSHEVKDRQRERIAIDNVVPSVVSLTKKAGKSATSFNRNFLFVLYSHLVTTTQAEVEMCRLWTLVLNAISANKRLQKVLQRARHGIVTSSKVVHPAIYVENGLVCRETEMTGSLDPAMLNKVKLASGAEVQEVSFWLEGKPHIHTLQLVGVTSWWILVFGIMLHLNHKLRSVLLRRMHDSPGDQPALRHKHIMEVGEEYDESNPSHRQAAGVYALVEPSQQVSEIPLDTLS
ncbi:hypothetical protein QFC19_000675 [Naganishia cerealis]|uniref:Uncharacterized protein n=1 Tax=Naganishia cerealis TaxID=610337 RepID=A0ACC2WMW7_9TREE|nr:hypothetical protein QFC19_000675 [Naganishia cerealis]